MLLTPQQRLLASASAIFLKDRQFLRVEAHTYRFVADRPGPDWHAHGYFAVSLRVLQAAKVQVVLLLKPRWKHKTTGATTHSAPHDLFALGNDPLVVAVLVAAWLHAHEGVRTFSAPFADLNHAPSRRTLQRWMRRLLARVDVIEDALREVLRKICEPRPWESLFPRGLSPPEGPGRSWRAPNTVWRLKTALALVFQASWKFIIPTATLLAEARGRETTSNQRN